MPVARSACPGDTSGPSLRGEVDDVETETVGVAEKIIMGCLLDKADVVYPLTLAEHIAEALREAGLLLDAPAVAPTAGSESAP